MIFRAAHGQIATTMTILVAANILTWGWAAHAFHGRPVPFGIALLAWVFGLRHAMDADHIAAVDNVVRKLVQSGRRAWDTGLFFALGHSATVLILCVCIIAFPSMQGVQRLREVAEEWGTLFSAVFLLLIGVANLLTLGRFWRGRHGSPPDSFSPTSIAPRGVLSRVLRPVHRLVTRAWHMLAIGFLFGLGFDTASEVALLALTAQQATTGLSSSDLLIYPALFTVGMVLVDTADSAVMTGAYGWASREPGRTHAYNMAITGLSVFVALGVGGVEILGLLADHGMPAVARMVADRMLDAMPFVGFIAVGAFLLLWGIAAFSARSRPGLAD